ncbi:MAG: sigma-70 family RNA polymerase sigma factor [Acidobacteria bacterium]|nr:sigma-70 family RNA polymerase sigma factor [Acidobacteriota bacterium]
MLLAFLFALLSEGDRELAARLQRRDPQAMADLYDRYGRLAYSLIFRIVKDAAVAEDLVQESFLRVWNRVQGFDPERGALGPWVLAVARNRAIDYLRSVDGRMAQSAVELEANEHPSMFTDLEREVLNRDRARHLQHAFERLNPHQRLVIELAYYEGLSQREMAERIKQPLGTVKTWVRSALQVLREELRAAAV